MDNPIFNTFYTITRLLCAFSLFVDRDLLKNTQTDGVKSTSDHNATTSSVIYYSTHIIIVHFYSYDGQTAMYQFEEAACNCIHLKN